MLLTIDVGDVECDAVVLNVHNGLAGCGCIQCQRNQDLLCLLHDAVIQDVHSESAVL